jgi:hypothetical protein
VGLQSLKSLNLTNGYPNNKNKKKKNNKVKSKPLELRSRVKNQKKRVKLFCLLFFSADGSIIVPISKLPVEPEKTDIVYDGKRGRAWIWDIAVDKSVSLCQLFLPASTRSVPPGIHFALLLLLVLDQLMDRLLSQSQSCLLSEKKLILCMTGNVAEPGFGTLQLIKV